MKRTKLKKNLKQFQIRLYRMHQKVTKIQTGNNDLQLNGCYEYNKKHEMHKIKNIEETNNNKSKQFQSKIINSALKHQNNTYTKTQI